MVKSLRTPPLTKIWKMVVEVDLEADDWQSEWKWQRMQPVRVGFDNQYLVGNDVADDDRGDQEWMGFALHAQKLLRYLENELLIIKSSYYFLNQFFF